MESSNLTHPQLFVPIIHQAFVRKVFIAAIGVMCLAGTTGCGTVIARTGMSDGGTLDGKRIWPVYPATWFDGYMYGKTFSSSTKTIHSSESGGFADRTAGFLGATLDLPFSLVFDTLALPYDLATMGKKGDRSDHGAQKQ